MLHFIAFIPPEPLKREIQKMKLEIKESYHSSHSLNAPPHITLLSPFDLKERNREEVHNLLTEFIRDYSSFDVHLKDYSTFGKRVIFMDVLKSEKLTEIQSGLEKLAMENENLFRYKYIPKPYNPHITLAFRDLTPENFERMWADYKDRKFEAVFRAESIYLLMHDGQNRQIEEEYRLYLSS